MNGKFWNKAFVQGDVPVELNVRDAFWADRRWLSSLDVACFSNPYEESEWLYWFQNGKFTIVSEAVVDGVAELIGFAACMVLSDGVFIEKICVKATHRRGGVSRKLIERVADKALDQSWPNVVTLTVPEIYMDPRRSDDISGWVQAVDFKVKTPLQPNFFTINGAPVTGYPCIRETA